MCFSSKQSRERDKTLKSSGCYEVTKHWNDKNNEGWKEKNDCLNIILNQEWMPNHFVNKCLKINMFDTQESVLLRPRKTACDFYPTRILMILLKPWNWHYYTDTKDNLKMSKFIVINNQLCNLSGTIASLYGVLEYNAATPPYGRMEKRKIQPSLGTSVYKWALTNYKHPLPPEKNDMWGETNTQKRDQMFLNVSATPISQNAHRYWTNKNKLKLINLLFP